MVLWLGLPVGEAVRRQAGDRGGRSGRIGGPETEAGVVPPQQGFRLVIGSPFWPVVQVLEPAHEFARLFAILPTGPSLYWEAGP